MISQDERIRSEVLEAASRLEEYLVTCVVSGGSVLLEGPVASDDHASQIEEIARAVPGVTAVYNNLLVEGLDAEISDDVQGVHLSPDFAEVTNIDDPLDVGDEPETYFPPTDPVVGRSGPRADNVEVLNGFASSSEDMTYSPGQGSGEDEPLARGDDELGVAVREALRMDSATADLSIGVHVRDGVAVLRGLVPTLDDAEMAEEVAASVPWGK